ncbi:Glucan endo-1,3-beta-glucosidase A1 precursor [Rubripirellula obstinata]|uniref:Glucan endo-1,3-beta-glucosidase A1 n=1 Tax=Rubripirellula obstinata TaxID=406547 RepID=A0A5B1CQE9_9BACT|nr:family 16 glycosylhydrolase [Rubripirellula obstinata]KAA1261860.1 Glucan endo-1,3-beta-glucosidase A1 precursor [Rubripirellula obstinata]
MNDAKFGSLKLGAFRRSLQKTAAIRIGICLLLALGMSDFALAQSVSMSGNQQPHAAGASAEITVTYESDVPGIVQVQLVDAGWKKVAEAIEKIDAGSGTIKLSVELPAATPPAADYLWQALLYNAEWKKQAEETVGDAVVGPSSDSPSAASKPAASKSAQKPSTKKPVTTDPVKVSPSGQIVDSTLDEKQWVPPGNWKLDWADEFSGKGLPEKWFPMIGYNPDAFKKNEAKGLRWTGPTEDSAWMYSTKTGNHMLTGSGQLAMRIVCDKTQTNQHGPKVNAAYLLTGYPDRWDSTEPNNAKWAGKFFSPAEGPLYLSASVRSDKVLGYSTWFAFWLFTQTRAYNGNPTDGTEIDVVEIVKGKPEYMSHVFNVANHWKESGGSESKQFNSASRPRPQQYVDVNDDQYHTYGVEWSKDSMKCFVDGKLYYTFTENIPTDPVDMMILLTLEFKPNSWDPNQGDGRTEGPFVKDTPEMREMSRVLIDYVRVFRKQDQ